MKKKIALALLAVALVVGGVAGGVYATGDHQPVQGQKLVGYGPLGISELGPRTDGYNTVFRFTNPDCVGEITITQVSIIKRDGTLIYEGPYIRVDGDVREIVDTPMMPHEGRMIVLCEYMWEGEGLDPENLTASDNWLSAPEALGEDVAGHTLEIAWEARKNVCPLTGWQRTRVYGSEISGANYAWGAESPMVNLKQSAK